MAEQIEHWMLRAAGFLGACTGRIVVAARSIYRNRLLRWSVLAMAASLAFRYAGMWSAAIALSTLAAILALSDVLIDEAIERMKGNG